MATSFYKAQEAMKTCEEHEHKEVSCFCKTCKKFICISCGKTTHNGHDWDLIGSVAKERRVETPKLCQKIKKENLPKCLKKLRGIRKVAEKERDEDCKKMEEIRVTLISMINRLIDEQKQTRNEIVNEVSGIEKKLDYLENITISLDKNILAYNDFDLLEMEQEMLRVLREVETYDVDRTATAVKFVPGEIDEGVIAKMIAELQETTMTKGEVEVNFEEEKRLNEFDKMINTIVPISDTQAWVGDISGTNDIKLLSSQNLKTQHMTLQTYNDFITLGNSEFVVTDYDKQAIRRVSSDGKESDIVSTKPLHPILISKTKACDILVTVMDNGEYYNLQSSSRRLMQRMSLTGKVLHTYEFREDNVTRLFTVPIRTAENGNSDICVVNQTSNNTGELIVLYADGRVRATYRGPEYSEFDPSDVACDSKTRIIVANFINKCLYLLSPDGTFLRNIISEMFDNPTTMALHQDKLWIGFADGTVKVYTYNK